MTLIEYFEKIQVVEDKYKGTELQFKVQSRRVGFVDVTSSTSQRFIETSSSSLI